MHTPFTLRLLALSALISAISAAPPSPSFYLERSEPLPKIPLCVPPDLTSITGKYPPSAVTTKQTGDNCTQYGDAPAPVVGDIVSPTGLENLIQVCGGEILTLTDNLGEERKVCFYANAESTKDKPLPLVVWLHPSLVSSTISWPLTGWEDVKNTQKLNNEDSSRQGFSYILPLGRNTVHQYPIPDNVGLGWDNWYRNFDRSSPSFNTDADFLDKAISLAKSKVAVDERRVYMSGWSNGASMALIYAMNTDGIAAASVYSAPDPYRDSEDPCTQVPQLKYATPLQDTHNYCDIIGICTTGLYFYTDLKERYPDTQRSFVVLDTITASIKSRDNNAKCDPVCQGSCGVTAGTLAHLRWPANQNDDVFFKFFYDHPLPASGSWGSA